MVKQVQLVHNILKYTYGLVPVVAGLDKFSNVLTDWSQYLSPSFSGMLPLKSSTFFMVIGLVEILAGILVLIQTRIGAMVVSVWLFLIAVVLISNGHYFDVAVRDIVMALGAFTLLKLNESLAEYERQVK
jgi:uncharacterized membrane protein YphA (DoxX/SURF4 family)